MPRLLTNIVLSEVSLVDEPANRKKFIIVKSGDANLADRAAELIHSLTEADAPERFIKGIGELDPDSRAGLVSLLETADSYSGVMPDVLAQTIAKLAEAAVGDGGLAMSKATADKVAAMKEEGNKLLTQIEALVEEAKAADGGKLQYADAVKSLNEFMSNLQWLMNSSLIEGDGPEAWVPTGVGTDSPLGKSGRMLSGDNLKKIQTALIAIEQLGGSVSALKELVASASVEKAERDTTEGATEVTEETTTTETTEETTATETTGTEAAAAQTETGSTEGGQTETTAAPETKPETSAAAPATTAPETTTEAAPETSGMVNISLAELDARIEAAKEEGAKAGAEAATVAMREQLEP